MVNQNLTPINITKNYVEAAKISKAWPFVEARRIVKRCQQTKKDEAVFETGYGPSGLPHIGTFGEVARTSMVINAFRLLTEDKIKVRLVCFSDDMDGMRRIPDNIPNQKMLEPYLAKPLSDVPNPFGSDHKSFAGHNNAKLQEFLGEFGFAYEFASATEYYKNGRFDETLKLAAEKYDEIMEVMLPTLGEERQATYSPFLPISPNTGNVLYVPTKNVDKKKGVITFDDEDGKEVTVSVTGGNVKMQWKPDFGMRWAALGVDFEMYGKDHQANSPVYDRICRILGARPPEHFVYELFLDDKGEKISKSKGNGLSVEEWLRYAPTESLSLFMYTKPKTAKRLFFDVIPRNVDDYLRYLSAFRSQTEEEQLNNPVWHIHCGSPPDTDMPVSFSMLLNLVSASNASDPETLWGFVSKYADVNPQKNPMLDGLISHAIRYYEDFVRPNKKYQVPSEQQKVAMGSLVERLKKMPDDADAETIQTEVYATGKEHGYQNLGEWFGVLYEVLLGQETGPRFGSFIALYGKQKTINLIEQKLKQ